MGVSQSTPHYPMILLMLAGQLGPAETFGIQWQDLNLESGRCAIVRNLTEVAGALVLKDVKTPSRRRNVRIPSQALCLLKNRQKLEHPAPGDFVFLSAERTPIRRTNFIRRTWNPLVKKAKVRRISPYKLRHSSASTLAALGASLLYVSRSMGHANIKTTANRYIHLFSEEQDAVAQKLDKFLKGVKPALTQAS